MVNHESFLLQILCARGYSDQLSGMSNSLILLVGTLASFPFGVLAYKELDNSILTWQNIAKIFSLDNESPILCCKTSIVFR